MRKIPAQRHLTADQIEQRANAVELEASSLKPGAQALALLEEARKLHTCADIKRLLSNGLPRS
jgi:hypothetical protein